MNYTVYKHTSPSGKSYIGITNRDPEKRWGTDGIYYKGSKLFYNAICKYGWNNIKHEILFTGLSESEAKQKEIELISHYKAFNISYNLTNGGDGSLGLFPNEETRRKIGEKSKERKPSLETKQKISNSLKGIKKPEGFGEKISNALKGRKQSTEHREKNRLARLNQKRNPEAIEKARLKLIGRKHSEEHVEKCKRIISIPIIQYDLNGNFICFWESARAVFFELGYPNTHIIKCCKGKLKSAFGYKWKYLSEEAVDV